MDSDTAATPAPFALEHPTVPEAGTAVHVGSGALLGHLEPTSAWYQWPADVPRPTQEQINEANERYMKTVRPETMSDYDMGNLFFVMATWNRDVWWPFFFPEDKAKCEQALRRGIADLAILSPNTKDEPRPQPPKRNHSTMNSNEKPSAVDVGSGDWLGVWLP